MKLTNARILLISLIAGLVIATASGIPVRWLWSSPGGSAYGIGFPMAYRFKYCGGYAPCYWTNLYSIIFAEDALIWLVIAAIVMFIAKHAVAKEKRGR